MKDIPLENLLNNTESAYEAVVVMFHRARQINDEQKLQIEMEMDAAPLTENRDNEDFDEVEIDREALLREHKKYPKPSLVAIKEMAEGKLKFRYMNPSEEKGEGKEAEQS